MLYGSDLRHDDIMTVEQDSEFDYTPFTNIFSGIQARQEPPRTLNCTQDCTLYKIAYSLDAVSLPEPRL